MKITNKQKLPKKIKIPHLGFRSEHVYKQKAKKDTCLKGFPLLNPKLELTIIATQNAMKITRNATSRHFLLCLMIPPTWVLPSLEGYLPITAPKGPLISLHTLPLYVPLALLSLNIQELERESRGRGSGRDRKGKVFLVREKMGRDSRVEAKKGCVLDLE